MKTINKALSSILAAALFLTITACSDSASGVDTSTDMAPQLGTADTGVAATSSIGRKCEKSTNPISAVTTYLGEVEVDGSIALAIYSETKVTTGDGSATQYSLKHNGTVYSWGLQGSDGGVIKVPAAEGEEMDAETTYQMADYSSAYGKCDKWPIDASMLRVPSDINFPSS